MSSGISSVHKILKDKTRRRIILLLREKGSLSYMDLMSALGITNTGKMNYHLKVLDNLLSKRENGRYALTEKGMLTSQLLLKFPEKTTKRLLLSSSDILNIGIAGVILAVINPFIWGTLLGGTLITGYFSIPLYAIFVPSAVMWWLTTNKTNTHDFYEFFKPPLISAFVFTIISILFIVACPWYSYLWRLAFDFLFFGFAPFFGIAVIEAFYRITESR